MNIFSFLWCQCIACSSLKLIIFPTQITCRWSIHADSYCMACKQDNTDIRLDTMFLLFTCFVMNNCGIIYKHTEMFIESRQEFSHFLKKQMQQTYKINISTFQWRPLFVQTDCLVMWAVFRWIRDSSKTLYRKAEMLT